MRTGARQLRDILNRADEEQRQLDLAVSVYNVCVINKCNAIDSNFSGKKIRVN